MHQVRPCRDLRLPGSTKPVANFSAEGAADPEQQALLQDLCAEQGAATPGTTPCPQVPWGWPPTSHHCCGTESSSLPEALLHPQPSQAEVPKKTWNNRIAHKAVDAHNAGRWVHVQVHMQEWEGRPGNLPQGDNSLTPQWKCIFSPMFSLVLLRFSVSTQPCPAKLLLLATALLPPGLN